MDSKTKELVEAAEARAEAATPGPWINVHPHSQECGILLGHTGPSWGITIKRPFPITAATSIRMVEKTLPTLPTWSDHEANATFIVHARADVPALCAIIREQDVKATAAIELIFRHGMTDGSHHKQWCLDQALRLLLGNEYDERIKQENADEDYASWDEGIAP